MTTFSATTTSQAVVEADRAAIWKALTDPQLLPRLTPFLRSIDVDGDLWTWRLSTIGIMGASISPVFTEAMTFTEPTRIEYEHQPPQGARERAGVNGWYSLQEVSGGTELSISLGVEVDLPFPGVARPAVTTAMKGVLAGMGNRFSANLLEHLGVRR